MSDVNASPKQDALVIVEMDGGLITNICANRPDVRVLVVNYDLDGVPADDIATLRQSTDGEVVETDCTITEYSELCRDNGAWENVVVDAWQRRYQTAAALAAEAEAEAAAV